MAPYPSQEEIATMFKKMDAKGGGFMDHMHKNVKIEVMGHDHESRGHHHGSDAVANDLFGQYDWMDWSTLKVGIRHVIGGGESSWAAVEGTSHGEAKKGKPLNHEWVFIVNFDTQGMITEGRLYLDSAHFADHRDHHDKN